MYLGFTADRLSTSLTRSVALAIFVAAACKSQAQQTGTATATPAVLFETGAAQPEAAFSSSIATDSSVAPLASFGGGSNNQPPPRRYGRPSYNDSTHNPDGSNKWTFAAGAGFTAPVGITHKYLGPSYDLQLGGGRNFNKTYGLLLEFDFHNFGMPEQALNNQLAVYQAYDPSAGYTSLSGTSHVWSFTLDPIIHYYTSDKFGAYVIGGAGFYHKVANFTTPGVYCDISCYNVTYELDKYSSNAFGVNGGLGFTYKLSRFDGERLFGEVRYVWSDNQPRPFSYSTYNLYPANSYKASFIPVVFGVRW